MIIETISVRNFRSILNETLRCESMTVLVGANGTGKSSFLRALDLFYNLAPKVETEDFYDRDTSKNIVISVTFTCLGNEAKREYAKYLQGDKLTVERVIAMQDGRVTMKYHGASLQCAAFKKVRDAFSVKDRGKTAKAEYESIRQLAGYTTLPAWTNLPAATEALSAWETSNSGQCVYERDDGQFFGFKEVGNAKLERFTRFLFVPAVRDATNDATEGRGSVLTSLMELVVRSSIAKQDEVKRLQEKIQTQYEEIMSPEKRPELGALATEITTTLRTFVPEASIELTWQSLGQINLPPPQADVKLVEDGYSSAVIRSGHGLQRAYILTMLQHLARAQSSTEYIKAADDFQQSDDSTQSLPNLILAIEEPELYQHPSRQRYLAIILMQLAKGKTPGVADNTQVIYCTHSPLFVGIDRLDQMRILRKQLVEPEKPKATKVISTTLDFVAQKVRESDGMKSTKYTGDTLGIRLRAIMTPWMNEGFFADAVVLVEGQDDQAVVLGTARANSIDLESLGITVIPCGGKNNLDRPAIIFRQLQIPVYLIWDGDKGKGQTMGKCDKCGRRLDKKADPADNRRLLSIVGGEPTDWPNCVEDSYACFAHNLEATLADEIGEELFETLLEKFRNEYGISERNHAIKNPTIIELIVRDAKVQHKTSPTLEKIVTKIVALRPMAKA